MVLALVLMRVYPSDDGRVETVRSFFGVHKIVVTPNGQYHVLMHGTTIHGAEKFQNDDGTPVTGRPEPITYYHKDGGIGQGDRGDPRAQGRAAAGRGDRARLRHADLRRRSPARTGSSSRSTRSMVDTARDPKYFTYIQNCEPDLQPVIGDARLTFANEPDGAYDLIIVDAYSSDAIPIHLATEEAMAIYKAKLAPQGAVLMHVSNRHLELSSVVVGIADANDLKSWVFNEDSGRDAEYIFSTSVVISARDEADVGRLAVVGPMGADRGRRTSQRVWTDDYSNVLGAVWRRLRDGEEHAAVSRLIRNRHAGSSRHPVSSIRRDGRQARDDVAGSRLSPDSRSSRAAGNRPAAHRAAARRRSRRRNMPYCGCAAACAVIAAIAARRRIALIGRCAVGRVDVAVVGDLRARPARTRRRRQLDRLAGAEIVVGHHRRAARGHGGLRLADCAPAPPATSRSGVTVVLSTPSLCTSAYSVAALARDSRTQPCEAGDAEPADGIGAVDGVARSW